MGFDVWKEVIRKWRVSRKGPFLCLFLYIYIYNLTGDIFVPTTGWRTDVRKKLSFSVFIIKVNAIFKIIIIGNSIRWEAKWKTTIFVQENWSAGFIYLYNLIIWGPMNKYILQWKCGFGAWEKTIMFSCSTHWMLLENHQNVNWISYSYIYITKRKCVPPPPPHPQNSWLKRFERELEILQA